MRPKRNGDINWLYLSMSVTFRYRVKVKADTHFISRPTPRLLSYALCLEWINGIYNTPDTGCLVCYRAHASVNTITPKIDRKHAIVETC